MIIWELYIKWCKRCRTWRSIKKYNCICAGVAAGIGLGDNTFAALITRGLSELARLGIELGGERETFYGLSGLGDLIVTVWVNTVETEKQEN